MALTKADNRHLTHQDYFDLEQARDQRFEYLAGEVFAMVGGTESHALIAMNAGAALVNALRERPCRVYGSDMKLYVAAKDSFFYPDLMVLCEQGRRSDLHVEDPVLIVEVLSDSTESYDRGEKFEHYRSIPTLQHYLLLNQRRLYGELFTRQPGAAWLFQESAGEQAELVLQALGVHLRLAELYRNVALPEQPLDKPAAPDEHP